jgi:hypothetical protein
VSITPSLGRGRRARLATTPVYRDSCRWPTSNARGLWNSPSSRNKSSLGQTQWSLKTGLHVGPETTDAASTERIEEERKQKVQAKAEANKPKKVTLAKLKFLEDK